MSTHKRARHQWTPADIALVLGAVATVITALAGLVAALAQLHW